MRLRSNGRIFAGLFILLTAAAAVAMRGERCTIVSGTDVLSINLDHLMAGQAEKFCYAGDAGRRIRFVLARGEDGKVRSVFDACRRCSGYHKGYATSHGELICRACGNRYPIERMTSGKASCVPVSLAHREEGTTAKIRITDLIAGRALF